jgi:hypothetical protein
MNPWSSEYPDQTMQVNGFGRPKYVRLSPKGSADSSQPDLPWHSSIPDASKLPRFMIPPREGKCVEVRRNIIGYILKS